MKAKIIVGIVFCSIILIGGLVIASKNDIYTIFLKDTPSDVEEDIAEKMALSPQEVLFQRIEQLRERHQEKENEETAGDETS